MRKRAFTVLMIMTVITVLCFTACGKEAMTLEKYCKDNPEVQQSIDESLAGSNVVVEIKGNDIIYSLDLSADERYTEEAVKDELTVQALESALSDAGPTFGNISKTIEDETKIEGIRTVINYTWGDEVIVTKTFTSADAAADTAETPAEDSAETTEGE